MERGDRRAPNVRVRGGGGGALAQLQALRVTQVLQRPLMEAACPHSMPTLVPSSETHPPVQAGDATRKPVALPHPPILTVLRGK